MGKISWKKEGRPSPIRFPAALTFHFLWQNTFVRASKREGERREGTFWKKTGRTRRRKEGGPKVTHSVTGGEEKRREARAEEAFTPKLPQFGPSSFLPCPSFVPSSSPFSFSFAPFRARQAYFGATACRQRDEAMSSILSTLAARLVRPSFLPQKERKGGSFFPFSLSALCVVDLTDGGEKLFSVGNNEGTTVVVFPLSLFPLPPVERFEEGESKEGRPNQVFFFSSSFTIHSLHPSQLPIHFEGNDRRRGME